MTWEQAIKDGYEVPSDQQSYTGRKVIIQHNNRFCVYENVNDNRTDRHVINELKKAICWAKEHGSEIGEQISHVEQKNIIKTDKDNFDVRKNDQSIGVKRMTPSEGLTSLPDPDIELSSPRPLVARRRPPAHLPRRPPSCALALSRSRSRSRPRKSVTPKCATTVLPRVPSAAHPTLENLVTSGLGAIHSAHLTVTHSC